MKSFKDLGTVYRTYPCKEYPGTWLTYVNGSDEKPYVSFNEAYLDAFKRWENAPKRWENAPDCSVSICWKCSDDDPRIGETWFTSFYQVGKIDLFGVYCQS